MWLMQNLIRRIGYTATLEMEEPMAHDSHRPSQSLNQEPISRTSHDKDLAGLSSSQDDFVVRDTLYRLFPYGHPHFNNLLLEIANLHSNKNQGYAGGGSPLGNFERAGKIMEMYKDFPYDTKEGMLVMYTIKHIDRILWDMSQQKRPSRESCRDIAVYMLILECMASD